MLALVRTLTFAVGRCRLLGVGIFCLMVKDFVDQLLRIHARSFRYTHVFRYLYQLDLGLSGEFVFAVHFLQLGFSLLLTLIGNFLNEDGRSSD